MKTYGDKAFSVCAPKLWNSLPLDLRKSPSLTGFKKGLKTCLFRQFLESGRCFCKMILRRVIYMDCK